MQLTVNGIVICIVMLATVQVVGFPFIWSYIYIRVFMHMYTGIHYVCMYFCMYTCIYVCSPPPVDRPCPCDSVLLAGDSAEILYLNTHHTTIICIVDIQRVLLTCHVLRTHAPDARHMS